MAQTAQPTQIMSANSLAALSPAQRQQYLASLSPDQANQAQAQYAQYVDDANRHFMALGIRKTAVCPPTNGGVSGAYTAGTALTYDFATAGGAYADALIITCALTVTLGAGAAAVYGINQAGILSVFDNLQVLLNGVQHNLRPYIIKYLGQLRGYGRSLEPTTVIAGQKSTAVENALNNGGTYPVAVGANTWNFKVRIPMNAIADTNPAGLLPMQAAGTKPQVVLTCAPNPLGPDPVLNVLRAVSGTGHTVAITGTVQVDVEYRDGTNLWSPQALALDLTNAPTVQYVRDNVLNIAGAGTVQRGRLVTLLQHYVLLLTLMDGTTSGQYLSALSNVQIIELDMDAVGQNKFFQYGTGTNVSIFDFYEKLRRTFGQDLDDGIVPWVTGATEGITNADNRDGAALLNMMVGGWTDVNHGVQFGSVGAVYTPRVEVHLISLNPAGLKLIQL